MRSILIFCFTLIPALPLQAQLLSWAKGNDYRTPANKLYWKNKLPNADYWQQDVYYQIRAKLDDSAETITGEEELVYYNNSPFTLTEAYFHLYQNAVQPGSLVDELYTRNHTDHTFGKYEKQGKGTEITALAVNGVTLPKQSYRIDYTVMRCQLPVVLKPGDSCVFRMGFTTYFDRGTIRRRMKVYDHHGYKHFNGVHWYPRICVFDGKFTWETAQHMEHEFYGDYGAYDVELQLPNQYVNEATGVLQNFNEVYPGDLRAKLDISRFEGKKVDSEPSVVITPDGTYKSWKYHATNVHDFAWTADPTYRIGEATWNGIQCIALAQENNAGAWQKSAQFTADVIATYSRDFGMYEYPKMVAADAADGMEYPMLTLDGGYFPSHRGLIAHEVGHNWFFGMVGNNETYRACLDEGFTQFLTSWSMRKLTGQFTHPNNIDPGTVYAGYIRDAMDGKDPSLNTHSDDFNNAIGHGGGYGHVYYKTATMLYNLEYTLGDSVFLKAMKDYVAQWKICHPYIEDFRSSITRSVGTDLNWFFDQWFETSKYTDYKIKKVKSLADGSTRIAIQRKGDMIMPVDLLLIGKDGGTLPVTIPVSQYRKPGSINTLPWTGWGKLHPVYSFDIRPGFALKQVLIDPSGRLADINRMNNTWKHHRPWKLNYENGQDGGYQGDYKVLWRPDVWYNTADGIKLGFKWNGQYAMRRHVTTLRAWYGTGIGSYLDSAPRYPLSWQAQYSHQIRKKGTVELETRFLAGLWWHKLGWSLDKGADQFYVFGKYMDRKDFAYLQPYGNIGFQPGFLPAQAFWSQGRNISLNLGYRHSYVRRKGNGSWNLHFRSSTPWSEVIYGYIQGTWLHTRRLGKTDFKIRAFAMAGQGSAQPAESMLYASGANPEELQDNRFTRDLGSIPLTDLNLANASIGKALTLGGGLNLRGYQGYTVPVSNKDTVFTTFRGNSGAALNGEWDISGWFGFIPRIPMVGSRLYLFGDAGVVAFPRMGRAINSGLLADAGVGYLLELKNWNKLWPLKKKPALLGSNPLRIRFDMPLFVNRIQAGESYLAFRWILGINRAF
ncbi:MAG: M1 family metallopeptidase [Bacteroidetes bacterium]|nr:M1 family metallopeptidase [Bacteroidota bacterium]